MDYLDDIFALKGKTVVITGASGQLGSVLSKAFQNAGAVVIGTDIAENAALDLEYYKLDVTKKKEIADVFSNLAKKHGGMDILINNAGVNTFEPFPSRSEKKFNWVMNVNLKGTFLCIQAYVDLFNKKKCEKGSIVNIGSVFGVVSPDFRNYTDCTRKNSEVYGASKAGIIQMTKYFAVHLAERNIRVNAVSPGGINDPKNPQGEDFIKNYSFRVPMKRMAEAKEIAGAVLYLAGESASYTTGQNMVVDGGMTCW